MRTETKSERLARLRAAKESKNSGLDNKVVEAMNVEFENPPAVVNAIVDRQKTQKQTAHKLTMREEQLVRQIYDQLLEKFNLALQNKGVQIAEKAEFKSVLYTDKDWLKTIKQMGEEGWIYAFPKVDPNDGYKLKGMVFQKIITKSVKLK